MPCDVLAKTDFFVSILSLPSTFIVSIITQYYVCTLVAEVYRQVSRVHYSMRKHTKLANSSPDSDFDQCQLTFICTMGTQKSGQPCYGQIAPITIHVLSCVYVYLQVKATVR